MRSFRIDAILLISFAALMKFHGAELMEIENELAGPNSSHHHLGLADQVTSNMMSGQHKELGPGKRSRDEDAMITESSSSPPSMEGRNALLLITHSLKSLHAFLTSIRNSFTKVFDQIPPCHNFIVTDSGKNKRMKIGWY
jgi:hypothetical protein